MEPDDLIGLTVHWSVPGSVRFAKNMRGSDFGGSGPVVRVTATKKGALRTVTVKKTPTGKKVRVPAAWLRYVKPKRCRKVRPFRDWYYDTASNEETKK